MITPERVFYSQKLSLWHRSRSNINFLAGFTILDSAVVLPLTTINWLPFRIHPTQNAAALKARLY